MSKKIVNIQPYIDKKNKEKAARDKIIIPFPKLFLKNGQWTTEKPKDKL